MGFARVARVTPAESVESGNFFVDTQSDSGNFGSSHSSKCVTFFGGLRWTLRLGVGMKAGHLH